MPESTGPTLLSINNYHYRRGGADALFLEENRLLRRSGWNVVPFSMNHEKNDPSEWSEYFVDEIEFGAAYSLFAKVARAPKVIYSYEARAKLRKLLDQVHPAAAHAHNIYHHLSPSILGVLKGRGIPIVLTLHDLKLACPAYKMRTHDGICERCKGGALHNAVLHRCLKNSIFLSTIVMVESAVHRLLRTYDVNVDRFVVPSKFLIDKLVEWGWKRDRFAYLPNFVDIDRLRPVGNVGEAFLYFGRLVPEKGLETLVRAAALAHVPLWIGGAGEAQAGLERLSTKHGANVRFLGLLNGERLRDVISSARMTVAPSEIYENCPMSVLESYALGRAVIGARIGGIPELVADGETGFLFQSGDADALASRLRRVADMPDRAVASMGQSGRRLVERNFTAQAYQSGLIEIFRDTGVRC